MASKIRGLVSKKKKRFTEDGFDLDLSYVTPRVIAMGFPAHEKGERLYRNDISDVVRFFETRHKDRYKIYNLCQERKECLYDRALFHNRVEDYLFIDHHPPNFELIMQFCRDASDWLQKDKDNVVAVHCKAGKGRTGLMVCSFLLHIGAESDPETTLGIYSAKRTENQKGVTIPSQKRYVRYYADFVRRQPDGGYCPKRLIFKKMVVSNSTNGGAGFSAYFEVSQWRPGSTRWEPVYSNLKASQDHHHNFKKLFQTHHQQQPLSSSDHSEIVVNDRVELCGDVHVKFFVNKKGDARFHFHFNTLFVEDQEDVVVEEERRTTMTSKHDGDEAAAGKTRKISGGTTTHNQLLLLQHQLLRQQQRSSCPVHRVEPTFRPCCCDQKKTTVQPTSLFAKSSATRSSISSPFVAKTAAAAKDPQHRGSFPKNHSSSFGDESSGAVAAKLNCVLPCADDANLHICSPGITTMKTEPDGEAMDADAAPGDACRCRKCSSCGGALTSEAAPRTTPADDACGNRTAICCVNRILPSDEDKDVVVAGGVYVAPPTLDPRDVVSRETGDSSLKPPAKESSSSVSSSSTSSTSSCQNTECRKVIQDKNHFDDREVPADSALVGDGAVIVPAPSSDLRHLRRDLRPVEALHRDFTPPRTPPRTVRMLTYTLVKSEIDVAFKQRRYPVDFSVKLFFSSVPATESLSSEGPVVSESSVTAVANAYEAASASNPCDVGHGANSESSSFSGYNSENNLSDDDEEDDDESDADALDAAIGVAKNATVEGEDLAVADAAPFAPSAAAIAAPAAAPAPSQRLETGETEGDEDDESHNVLEVTMLASDHEDAVVASRDNNPPDQDVGGGGVFGCDGGGVIGIRPEPMTISNADDFEPMSPANHSPFAPTPPT